MERGKAIPILIIAFLLVLAVYVFINNKEKFSKLTNLAVTYNNQTENYKDLTSKKEIIINDKTFFVNAVQKNYIVLSSVESYSLNGTKTSEYKISKGTSTLCFQDNDCVTLTLS